MRMGGANIETSENIANGMLVGDGKEGVKDEGMRRMFLGSMRI